MEFEYKMHGEGITLLRCYGTEERIEIPDEIDGHQVNALGPYIFSQSRREPDKGKAICGSQVKEIILPKGIREIGNYAFYGCFSLEKITFYHNIHGIGGGVFTGCHRLHEMKVYMEEAEGYSLKNILGELHHEIKVELCYEQDYCKILIPEFYEEAVENTPARNVDMAFHGSGYSYRQCFRDGILQFAEYDAAFDMAHFLESEDFLIEQCLLRLKFPYELGETARGIYVSWLMEHRMSAGKWCIFFEQMEEMELLFSFIDWREEEMDEMIKEANERKKLDMLSYLMDYKHIHFKKKKKTFDL